MNNSASSVKLTPLAIRIWCIGLCITVALAAYSFHHLDVPVAKYCAQGASHIKSLADGLAGTIIVGGEALVLLLIVALRHVHGNLPKIVQVLAIACITSICCYALNSAVLKVIFGVPNPGEVLNHGAIHAFHWMKGTKDSSFPSGHMMLAGGWGGVFMYCYPKSVKFLGALVLFGMCLLVVGDWHFISDVLIGAFCGLTAGMIAGELWTLHTTTTTGPST